MAACRSSSKNTGKMSLIPVFNKNSPRAHSESELDMLGVHGKLVKYVVHSSKRKNWKKIKKSSHKLAQTATDQFLVSRNLGVNQSKESVAFRCGYLKSLQHHSSHANTASPAQGPRLSAESNGHPSLSPPPQQHSTTTAWHTCASHTQLNDHPNNQIR
jgi:hypothetical protein